MKGNAATNGCDLIYDPSVILLSNACSSFCQTSGGGICTELYGKWVHALNLEACAKSGSVNGNPVLREN